MSRRFTALRTGPKLARRLAQVELGSLPDEALLDYAHAEVRQLSQQQARVWAAFAEIGRRAPLAFDHSAVWTEERRFDAAACELVAELRVSKPYAKHELGYAQDLEAMPAVAAALRAGQLDRNRVLVLLDVCVGLSEAHRDVILAEVLPTAGAVPPAKLRDHAQRLAIALDPEWAERRYREAVRRRRIVRYLNQDGTVTLAAEDQPVDEALAAWARLTALAKAAQRAGARASLDQLRSVVSMGLQGPRFTGWHERDIIAYLIARFAKPTVDEPAEPKPKPKPEPAPEPLVRPEPVVPCGVELRVGLATLMGLCDHPGEVAGSGPVVASVARDIALAQRRGEWRVAIVDQQGRLLHEGITRHRPATYPDGGASGGIVELHVPRYLLDPAFIEEHPQWAALLADLSRQYAAHKPIVQNPAARAPGQPLRRRVQVKDRYCVFPACRRPAGDTQTDHRHDYAHGGVTLENNLGPLCERHHDLKTRWGWRLIKRDAETYVWISPFGRRHVVKIEPVAPPLPGPRPRDELREHDPDPPETDAA